jgi:GGDEF domain-containing protein
VAHAAVCPRGAKRLSEKFVRSADTTARLGDDGFALLLPMLGCEQAQIIITASSSRRQYSPPALASTGT